MAAQAAIPFSLHLRHQQANRARFFSSWLRRIAPDTHQDQANGAVLPPPWRLCRPRRTLVPHRVQWVYHRPVAADPLAPIPCWLTWQAIRFCCTPVTASLRSIQTKWLLLQSQVPDSQAAVVTHAKQRFMSNAFFSLRMWKLARASLCASALMATTLFVFAFFRS
jgi:hypothetical protein